MSRIAVWNTAFLGDAILTLPLIQTLRSAYPGAEIHFYTRNGFAALFRAHPALDAVFEFDKKNSRAGALPAYLRELRSRRYALWISAHESFRSALVARGSGAARRIGYATHWFGRFCYTDRVQRRFGELQEVERLLQLVRPLGISRLDDWPDLVLPPEVTQRAASLFAGGEGPGTTALLGMHPGSVWGTKRWPVEYFAEIGGRALERGARVVLFAGPGEEDMAHRAEALIRERHNCGGDAIVNLAGRLSLLELAACIGRLDCYLSNDSGPMHLAWAQRVPVVALFGPTVRGLGFAPRGQTSLLLEVEGLKCRPCGKHGPQACPLGHHKCMVDLTPEQVWPAVEPFLAAAGK